MIVPQFWAEAHAHHREKRKRITVRRFGWSETSQAEAQARAEARATDVLQRLLAGETLALSEPKVPYNGAEGLPIREEIVARHGEVVITRNSYGALCLNTPDVLFADVDFTSQPSGRAGCTLSLVFMLLSAWVAWKLHSAGVFIVLLGGSMLLGFSLIVWVGRLWIWAKGGWEKVAMNRIRAFVARHPEWGVRVYRTPAGFRVLATHRTFAPEAPEVTEFFAALGTDKMYVTMCQRQQCFRARVSPKPWRIGIPQHLKPRPGVWPVREEALPARRAWVEAYHAKAAGFAACRFEKELGTGGVSEGVRRVQVIHDQLCRAESGLPIA